jgi:hypothetical protein
VLGRRPRLQLVLVCLLALVSLVALAAARPPFTKSLVARGDDLALAVAWIVATAAAVWLFVLTGASAIALGLGRPRLARRLAPALPARLRRVIEIAIVASCVAVPALPAGAAVTDQPVVRTPRAVAPVESTPITRPVPAPPAAARPAPAGRLVRVQPGDNLWSITRAALESVAAARVDDAAVARYWRVVIAANRSTLRSGDPSLIFPGEVVTLPPPGAVS